MTTEQNQAPSKPHDQTGQSKTQPGNDSQQQHNEQRGPQDVKKDVQNDQQQNKEQKTGTNR